MFFPEKITQIKEGDRVLEIGPGSTPFHRSDVLLEMDFEDEAEYEKQFGHGDKLVTDKQLVFYKGDVFPFKDNEFDYVICSHVLEHVPDVPKFLAEVFRVAPKGYFEFPMMYYEYLYNIDAHISYLKFDGKVLFYMPKKNTAIDSFKPVQKFLLETLRKGHSKMMVDIPQCFIQGFEWTEPFKAIETNDLNKLAHDTMDMPGPKEPVIYVEEETVMKLTKKLVKKIIGRE
jgi:SAM-dependent methyltransferase